MPTSPLQTPSLQRSKLTRVFAPAAWRVLSWCATGALYLILAGQRSRAEVITAVVLASLSVLWSASIRRCASLRFAMTPAHARLWARACLRLGPSSVRVALQLLRLALLGDADPAATTHHFEHGHIDSAGERSRRATALLIASLAPDSFIVRMPPGRDEVLIHRIVAARGEPDPRWLLG